MKRNVVISTAAAATAVLLGLRLLAHIFSSPSTAPSPSSGPVGAPASAPSSASYIPQPVSREPRDLLFQSGTVSSTGLPQAQRAAPAGPPGAPGSVSEPAADQTPRTWLIQVTPPLSGGVRAEIETAVGRPVAAFIPNNAFMIVAPEAAVAKARSVHGVVFVGSYPASAKISASVPSSVSQWQELQDEHHTAFRIELSPLEHKRKRTSREADAEAHALQTEAKHRNFPIRFRAVSNERVLFEPTQPLRFQELQHIIKWLSEKDVVHTIERAPKFRTHNKFAQVITQTGYQRQERVIWDRGIRGSGQIVGCADSGLDWGHCFFSDPDHRAPNRDARKVLSYTVLPGAQLGDGPDGHGTHVVGSITGDADWFNRHSKGVPIPDALRDFGGMAPEARVVFHGAGAGGAELPGLENVDIANDVLQPAYDAGARTHSNSWGANTNAYSAECKSLDEFVWNNRDMLVVFAAGNDGLNAHGKITGTVGSPGTAKNCLTIGASQTQAPEGWLKELDFVDWEGKRRAAEKALGERGLDCCNTDNHRVAEFCCKQLHAAAVKEHPDRHGVESMAPFSSRGPTFDGRIKPSVMAPGQFVTSSRSRGRTSGFHCKGVEDGPARSDLIAMAGTSMAAPVVAGNAVLARDYFLQGFYPSGKKNPADSMVPTAALLTALLSVGAQPLTGFIDVNNDGRSWSRLGQIFPPLIFQGFGRVNMETTLWFADSNSTWRLWLDQKSHVDTGQDQDYCFRLTGSQPLKIQLAWSDYPAQINVQVAQVNNLDLYAGKSEAEALAGNFVDKRDERNNAELIVADKNLQAGNDFHVKVRGITVPMGPQTYALVVNGQFDPQSVKQGAACPPFNIAADRFKPAGEAEYFPFGPVFGGIGGGILFLVLLCWCLRWCLRSSGVGSIFRGPGGG